MTENVERPTTVDAYIRQYPPDLQRKLDWLRQVILAAAPGAQEKLSYHMPGYYLNGPLVFFGVYRRHIGVYPTTAAVEAALPELAAYKGAKASLHFPLDQPLPEDLLRRFVEIRAAENLGRSPA